MNLSFKGSTKDSCDSKSQECMVIHLGNSSVQEICFQQFLITSAKMPNNKGLVLTWFRTELV